MSTTLDQPLNCPAGNEIFANASNVVLDLGGHSITGAEPSGTNTVGVRCVIILQNWASPSATA